MSFFGWDDNAFLYNFYLILSFPITVYIFHNILGYNGWMKHAYFGLNAVALIFFIINLLFFEGFKTFNQNTLILTEFLATLLSVLVLIKLFREDDFQVLAYNHPYFWISAGTLIFSLSMLVILGLYHYVIIHKIQIAGVNIYQVLTPIMNIILYGSYSYAFFLCGKLTRKLSLQ